MDAFWPAILFLGGQRVGELLYARRTARGLEKRGARAVRPDGYAAIVAVHVLFFAGCVAEWVWGRWSGLGPWTWAGAALFLAGEALRYSSMAALGGRWSTRVYALEGQPLVRRGPYRFLRHPIYLGVALELAGLTLAFGLWGTLVAVSVLNLLALRRRIRIEESALAATLEVPGASGRP
jgi:methyltransferase